MCSLLKLDLILPSDVLNIPDFSDELNDPTFIAGPAMRGSLNGPDSHEMLMLDEFEVREDVS